MTAKRVFRWIGIAMLLMAVGFVWFAVTHPQASWPWSNPISYGIYFAYFVGIVVCFLASLKKK